MTNKMIGEKANISPIGGSWARERWLGFMLAILGYSLYFPLTQFASTLTPVDVSTPLDSQLPLIPSWILIYGMIYPAALLPMVVVRDPLLFRRLILGYICLEACAMVVFVLVPVHMTIRPPIESITQEGFFPWVVQFCYWVDRPTCCLPSLHVAAATYSALCALRVDKWIGWGALLVAFLIAISTLLVKQHFVADVFLGAGLAAACYRGLMHSAVPLDSNNLAFPKSFCWIPLVFFLGLVASIYTLYVMGWHPWLTTS